MWSKNEGLDFFGEGILCLIVRELFCKSGGLVQLTGFQGIQIFVCLQLAFGNLQHFHSYIGAVVCGTLTSSQQILQYEAVFHGAKTITQSAHMTGLDLTNQSVNNLILGFNLGKRGGIASIIQFPRPSGRRPPEVPCETRHTGTPGTYR